jgi:hypothetical protein
MRIGIATFLVGLLGLGGMPTAQAVTLSFEPAVQNVQPGDIFEVGIRISDLGIGAAPSLGAFDIEIMFDTTVIDVTGLPSGVVFGDPVLGDQLDLPNDPNNVGTFPFAGFIPGGVFVSDSSGNDTGVLNSDQASDFILATLEFEALALGTSALQFSFGSFGGLFDASGDPLSAQLDTGSVTVAAIETPEPASLLLVLAGLMGLRYART